MVLVEFQNRLPSRALSNTRHVCAHTRTHMHTHSLMHAVTRTYTHAHTHTRTQTMETPPYFGAPSSV